MKVELKASIISAKLVEHNKYTWEPYELQHEKVYLLKYTSNEDSDRTAHSRSLIRVFVVRMKKLCILGYPKCAQRRFRSACTNEMRRLIWIFAGRACPKVRFLTLKLICGPPSESVFEQMQAVQFRMSLHISTVWWGPSLSYQIITSCEIY